MKQKFRDAKLSAKNLEKLVLINSIIAEYQENGYVLTLRQLYYQLVGRGVIPNEDRQYKLLSKLVKEGRMAGLVDWSAIEDRLRFPSKPPSWDNPKQILDSCIKQFQLPRQNGQSNYIEVWVEKDALSSVLKRVTEKYHIPIVVNRGYSSASSMYDSFFRFVEHGTDLEKPIKLIYLGDHDPSGLDMIRDIENRIEEFRQGYDYASDMDVEIIHAALTSEQVRFYDLPPNPAKMTDSRAGDYIAKHGRSSWEIDALRPEVLNEILEAAIQNFLDRDKLDEMLAYEANHIKKLKSLKDYL